MLTLREETFDQAALPVSTSWLLADCMEFRGKQDLWSRQRPEVLEALRQQAMIQSVESSNRIEGVTVSPERLAPLALGKARPRDRSEEELSGYRRALDWIYSRKSPVRIDARTIRHLHALSHAGAGDAGEFKSRDNEIIEILPSGQRRIRFMPTPAGKRQALVDDAIATAEAHPDKLAAALFLVERGQAGRAAKLVDSHPEKFEGRYYGMLLKLAEALQGEFPSSAWVLYRALLLDILEGKRSKAYHHAADYLAAANELATRAGLRDRQQELLGLLRQKHGRKYAFWSLVKD